MATRTYTDWNVFLNSIHVAEEELGNPPLIWYRGVSDYDYKLQPSLFRNPKGNDKERDLFERYQLIANRVFPDRRSDWELLADMQHYGIPTRFLDWTEVIGVAIFFSLLGNKATDSAVYLLDPIKLNMASGRDRIIQLGSEQPPFEYQDIYWRKRPIKPQLPVAAEARILNQRIYAQSGRFTIHGDDVRAIEDQFPQFVKKIRLPHGLHSIAQDFLKMAGLNEFSIFPDIVGMVPYLLDIVGMT